MPSLSVEVRAHPRLGVAVIGHAGVDSYTSSQYNYTDHARLFEIGAEPRYYFSGAFRGATLGAAVHYFRMHIDLTQDPGTPDAFILPFDFAGYGYGWFAGYKFTAQNGFTADLKFGMLGIHRTMSDEGRHADIVPLIDAKIGWSF